MTDTYHDMAGTRYTLPEFLDTDNNPYRWRTVSPGLTIQNPHNRCGNAMGELRTRDIFLVIYSSRLFPSHWGVFVPSSEGSDTGTLINVIGDPSVGFEHEFKRDYGRDGDDGRVSKTLLLGKAAPEHVQSRQGVGQSTNDTPNSTLEDIAVSIPPPSKSLRPSGCSVSIQTIHFLVVRGYRENKCSRRAEKLKLGIANRGCANTWLCW